LFGASVQVVLLLLLLLLQVAWLNAEVIATEMLALVQVGLSYCTCLFLGTKHAAPADLDLGCVLASMR
jgi:hypothetical protein